MKSLKQDLRYGVRMLMKKPGFTAVGVLALALGVGANTAIFSVVHAVLLRPLPYEDAERLVIANISPPDFRDLKDAAQSFDGMAIWGSNLYNVHVEDETTQVTGAIVSPEFFTLLGRPALGRVWRPDEDRVPLAVISHDLWQDMYGGDQNVVGKSVRLSGNLHTIVGVMPPEFQYPSSRFKLWVTFGSAMAATPDQMENRQFRIFRAVAHLRPGVSAAQMQAEVDAFSQQFQQQYPTTNAGIRIEFSSLSERILGDVRPALIVLLGTVGFVLLIACANVANLTLARTVAREREIAIRTALGASRGRMMRQLLTESLLLALAGGACGLLLAAWLIDVLPSLSPGDNIPRLTAVGINVPVLLFTMAVSTLTGILCGLVPAWQATRVSLDYSLKDGGRGAFGSVKGRRLRGALVVSEIALSLIVLIGAGLLINSFNRLLQVDRGFTAENLLTLNVGLVQYKDPARRAAVARQVIERVSSIPGVLAAGGGTGLPPITPQRGTRFAVQGLPSDNVDERSSYLIAISPDFFRALDTPLIDGRAFDLRDDADVAKVVIINRALARRLFPNESALGRRLQLINPQQSDDWREIVGVVGDVRYSGLDDPGEAAVYTPFAQTPMLWNYLMVRTAVPPERMIQAVRDAVTSVDSTLEAANLQTMNQLVSESVAQPRFYTLLLAAFALLALVLAAVGIYGVMSYSVTQRTKEIGIRLALGAGRGDVLKLVVGQGTMLTLIGVAIGLGAAFALTRSMASLLFGVSPTDPLTFFVISLLLVVISLLACYIPARRATKVDPMVALRYE